MTAGTSRSTNLAIDELYDIANELRIDSVEATTAAGHPTPQLPFVDVATGSLGRGR